MSKRVIQFYSLFKTKQFLNCLIKQTELLIVKKSLASQNH